MIMVSKVMTHRDEGMARLGLWLTGLVFVSGLHGAVGMLLCHGGETPMPDVPPMEAVMIDLPPASLAPSSALSSPVVPVSPAAPVAHAAVLPTPAAPTSTTPPRKPAQPRPEVTRPVATRAVAPKPSEPAPQASTPALAPVLPPPVAASGPTTATPTAPAPTASTVPNWQSALLGRLQSVKRYPQSARDRSEQGVAHVTFTMDRSGHVLSVVMARGSGSASLDEEAVAMIQRADPLPSPPAEIGGNTLTLTVPVRFVLNEAGARRQ